MSLAAATSGAADAYPYAHGDRHGDKLSDVADITHPFANRYADKGADMDPEPDRATVVYCDPDSNLIVYSHGYLHFATENYCDLDLGPDDDANSDRNVSRPTTGATGAEPRVQG